MPTLKRPAASALKGTMKNKNDADSILVPAAKRNRTQEADDPRATTQRLILLSLKKKTSYSGASHVASIFVPQHILQQIPVYESSFVGALDTKDRNHIPTITDEQLLSAVEQPDPLIKAINFLSGAPTPKIGDSGAYDSTTLSSLLGVYDVCIALEIEPLRDNILEHMSTCKYVTWDIFINFAKEVYGDTGNKKRAADSPVGKVIQLKLTAFLPQMMQDGTAQRISAMGGVLSAQLLDITIKQLSGGPDVKSEQSVKAER